MTDKVKKEVEEVIKKYHLNCSIEEFQNKVNWFEISKYQTLSENFIREFKDKVEWDWISIYQKLSEDFIKEFQNKVDWIEISANQILSEDFIREFQDKVYWDHISGWQTLSEDFIRKFQDRLDWISISIFQILSEEFIREFQDKVEWQTISEYQTFSNDFIKEFQDKIKLNSYNKIHEAKTYKQKLKEIRKYAKQNDLKINNKFLYAYREHDNLGRGIFSKAVYYEKGNYYKDWHCDMRESEEDSFGFGIWPKGNTKVRVRIEDWGVAVNREDGKARVWGFEMI